MTSHAAARWLAAILVIAATITLPARQVVRTGGPPPEIRALFDAFTEAMNSGSADAWEAFVQARFAPALLQKYSKEQRAEMYKQLAADFGTIAIGRVNREGPDAPLQLNVKGSKGSGVFMLGIDNSNPPRIVSFGVEAGDRDREPVTPGVPLPPLDRTLASDEIDRRLDGYFTKLSQADVFSGVALVARNGVPVFMKAYSLADR